MQAWNLQLSGLEAHKMLTSETITSIMPALLYVQSKVSALPKDGSNPFAKSKYVTLQTMVDFVRPILTDGRCVLTQGARPLHTLNVEYATRDAPGMPRVPVAQTVMAITVWSRITHADSGEWIESELTLPLREVNPQESGSIMTYGRRYTLGAILALTPDEDTDGEPVGQAPRPQRSAQVPSAPIRSFGPG